MGIEEGWSELQKKSWKEPVEEVNMAISRIKKKETVVHTRENHEYHMKKWGRYVYCDNNIPLSEDVKP